MRTRLIALGCAVLIVVGCGPAGTAGRPTGPSPSPTATAETGPVRVGAFPARQLRILAPAAPGGGWDGTSRAVQASLQEANIAAQPVEVYNRPGAGGTIGLAEFASQTRGDGHSVMTMGFVMVGAILTNRSAVNLQQVTPIARLTTEFQAIAVPRDSRYQNLQQLVDDFKANPRAIRWGGGSAGGVDHITVAMLAATHNVRVGDVNYIAFSGGGELMPQLLGGHVTVGVGGFGEFKSQAATGALRIIGVTAPQRIAGSDARTFREQGTNIEISNWRGIVGPREMPADHRQAWITMLQRMKDAPQWKEHLRRNDWTDAFLAGDQFGQFLRSEEERVGRLLRELGLVQ